MILALSSVYADGQSVIKQERDLDGFTRISFGISGNLYVEFGRGFSVVLEGDEDDLDEIITEVSNGRLVIKKENRRFYSSIDRKVTIRITMPELSGLGVSGSGSAQIVDPVTEADDLDLSVSGSGKLNTSGIVADRLNCSISGSGNIVIGGEGNADSGEIQISGSGNYSGENFEIDRLDVRVSGSGNCTCRAGDSLVAAISGSGNVTYAGNPRIDARVSGSGKVRSR